MVDYIDALKKIYGPQFNQGIDSYGVMSPGLPTWWQQESINNTYGIKKGQSPTEDNLLYGGGAIGPYIDPRNINLDTPAWFKKGALGVDSSFADGGYVHGPMNNPMQPTNAPITPMGIMAGAPDFSAPETITKMKPSVIGANVTNQPISKPMPIGSAGGYSTGMNPMMQPRYGQPNVPRRNGLTGMFGQMSPYRTFGINPAQSKTPSYRPMKPGSYGALPSKSNIFY